MSAFDLVRSKILDDFLYKGDLSAGSKLPTAEALAQKYGVSYATIGKVVSVLASEGWVTRRRGSGIYVASEGTKARPPVKEKRIGVIAGNLHKLLPTRVLEGVERYAYPRSAVVEVASSFTGLGWEKDVEKEEEIVGRMRERGVDGVILYPTPVRKHREYLGETFRDFPVVVVDLYQDAMKRPHLVFDNQWAGREMGRLFLSQGRREMIFLRFDEKGYRSLDDRFKGMTSAFSEASQAIRTRVLDLGTEGVGSKTHLRLLEEILKMDPRPAGLVAPDDRYAHFSAEFFRARGLRVPEDILVAGFDALQEEEWGSPFPTTRPDFVQMGERAAALLMDLFEAPSNDIKEILLPCPLVHVMEAAR